MGYLTVPRVDQASLYQCCCGNVPSSCATVSSVTGATATQVVKVTDVSAALFHHSDRVVYGAITVIYRENVTSESAMVETWTCECLCFYPCSSRRWRGPGRSLCLLCRCNLRQEWWHQPRCSAQTWKGDLIAWSLGNEQAPLAIYCSICFLNTHQVVLFHGFHQF